jgi:hypothetical protein
VHRTLISFPLLRAHLKGSLWNQRHLPGMNLGRQNQQQKKEPQTPKSQGVNCDVIFSARGHGEIDFLKSQKLFEGLPLANESSVNIKILSREPMIRQDEKSYSLAHLIEYSSFLEGSERRW